MQVKYKDQRLALIETDRAAETKLPISVINSYRRKVVVLRAAPDERTLRNWKSLHYEQLKGDRKGLKSIRLNDQWRLVFELDNTTTPPTMLVDAIEDYH